MTAINGVNIRVLVVDDHKIMRSLIVRMLNAIGIKDIVEAANGEEAMNLLLKEGETEIELIISDLHMDKMDGSEFCHRIRKSKEIKNPNIPIVVLTGEKDDMVLEVVRQVGADMVLQKPLTPNQLRECIEASIGIKF